jgi:pimeloyl-ACP methyl ester carboxylesterase
VGVTGGVGRPVMLIPGFGKPDAALATMAHWLARGDYRTHRGGVGRQVGCGERSVDALERRAERIAEDSGMRLAVIGHSRGGHFARVLAKRRPDLVAGIVTLGMPSLRARGVHPLVGAVAIGMVTLGTLRAPGLLRASCFLGHCCSGFRRDLYAPFPDDVLNVSVLSRNDGMVAFERTHHHDAEHVEIRASHLGVIVNHEAYAAIAAALGRLGEPAPL